MKAASRPLMRVIWTVDPFEKDQQLQAVTAHAVKLLVRGIDAVIEPVYFLNSSLSSGPIVVPREWLQNVQQTGQKEIQKIVKRIRLSNVRPLHLISLPYLSIREAVERINQLAIRWDADLIVSSTHARKGLKRFFLGSFAETLLLHSQFPLLFVNPQWKRQFRFKNILFPTDFSRESYEAFLQVLPLARSLQSEVNLFHKLIYTWPAGAPMTMESAPLFQDVFSEELKAKNDQGIQWADEGKSTGVTVTTEIDDRQDRTVAQSILLRAKRTPGVIAMASKSSPIRTTLLGSTTRKIVRESPFPVWVLNNQAEVRTLKKFA